MHTGRDGRDQPKVVKEVLADLKSDATHTTLKEKKSKIRAGDISSFNGVIMGQTVWKIPNFSKI